MSAGAALERLDSLASNMLTPRGIQTVIALILVTGMHFLRRSQRKQRRARRAAEEAAQGPKHRLRMQRLDDRYAVCRFSPETCSKVDWAKIFSKDSQSFAGVIRTDKELSIIVASDRVVPVLKPTDKDKVDDDWVAFEVLGPLPFDMVGVMAQLSNTLASAGVSLLAQSSYDTDYIFVKEKDADQATVALVKSGVGLGAEKN